MLKIIGSEGCGRCLTVLNLLKNKGVDFDYVVLSALQEEEVANLMQEARGKKMMSLPLIKKDGELITLEEALKC